METLISRAATLPGISPGPHFGTQSRSVGADMSVPGGLATVLGQAQPKQTGGASSPHINQSLEGPQGAGAVRVKQLSRGGVRKVQSAQSSRSL